MIPWLARMTALLGLYEFPGEADNPAILEMAKFCGGQIAKTYEHDSIPWCALGVNYCLIWAGFTGTDSLLALDFRKYGVKLNGPAVGAIATKTRGGGGHVTLVAGRTADGKIVGRGGNQDDMVCDELFDPSVFQYNWPGAYPMPLTGFDRLPVIEPEKAVRRIISLSDIGKPTDVNSVPLSIKTHNPGAMWGGKRATKWGATEDRLTGDKQGNHIAVFPTSVQGAAAQFDLWRTGYVGLTLAAAIKRWSGDNDATKYTDFLVKTTGVARTQVITEAFLSGDRGLALMKAQAQWEAGREYPMTDAEWKLAQGMVFHAVPPPPDIEKPDTTEPQEQETKPAVHSSELWTALLALISTAGSMLTDWRFLAFLAVAGLLYLLYRRYTRGDISGIFK